MKKLPSDKSILHFLGHYFDYLPYIAAVVAVIVLLVLLISFVLRLLGWKSLLKRKMVCLELTPPAFTPTSVQSSQKLFNVLHGLKSNRSFKDRLLMRPVVWSQEISSVRESGIRFHIRVQERLVPAIQNYLHAFLPDAKLAVVSDSLPALPNPAQVIEFKQSGHYAFPLASHNFLEDHDPVAFLTTVMNKLAPNEFMGFQLVFQPVQLREAAGIANKILTNDDLLTHLTQHNIPLLPKINEAFASLSFGLMDLISEMFHPSSAGYAPSYTSHQRLAYDKIQVAKRIRPARTLSAFEQEIVEKIHGKVSQPLFAVSIRAVVVIANSIEAKERLSTIKSSLESYSVPGYQSLKPKSNVSFLKRYRNFTYLHRLPAISKHGSCILSASEIASLYHFPIGNISRTDNLVTSLSRTLAAPISLKQNTKFDVVIGLNDHHGTTNDIGLSAAERERHVYIIGGTGNGKTTMLQYMIVQDMKAGKGLAIVDPHGDMAETILRHIPKDRIKDVIYFNPDDLLHPIGLNLLELREGLTGAELMREKDLITESVISVFRKIFSDEDTGGHRVEYVLRNAIQTALTVEGATLFTVFNLLNNSKYRKKVIAKLDNEDLKNFWNNELAKAGEMQKVKMAAGITAKVGRFLFSASAKQILEQPKSTIDFDGIINSGKILICNFSKGLIGEDTSELFGITILAKLQLASLRRARLPQTDRKPFYLYVDEFQNFATASFVQMLSESRKYKLFMTMAEQSTSQQKDQQMVSIILANVGTVISFRTGNPQDERLLLPLFSPYIKEGEISNLSSFNFYARLSAIKAQEPLSGQTLLLSNEGSSKVAEQVIKLSRKNYALKLIDKNEERHSDIEVSTSAATKDTNTEPIVGKMLDIVQET